MKNHILIFAALLLLVLGIVIGGFLFSRTIPRQFINIAACQEECIKNPELMGLLGSLGIQYLGKKMPGVIYETDRVLVLDWQYPYPPDKIHYIVVPKKDIKNIGELTEEDRGYVDESYAVMGKIVRENNYTKYRVVTNGPGFQEVAYLHFHLVIDRKQP